MNIEMKKNVLSMEEKTQDEIFCSRETPEDHRRRWRSLRILYVTMFFDSLSFSIVLSSIWPYIKKIDSNPDVSPIYAGWANVGFQVAGICMDFLMGLWTNKRGSTEPLLFAISLFALGNLLYGYAQACGTYGVAVVIIARTIIGLSTGTDVVTKVVISEATTLKERTTVMAHMSIAHGLGFSFGPAVQLASIPLGDNGYYFEPLRLYLDLYTAPAFASVVIAIFNIILVLLWYHEYKVDIYKDSKDDEKIEKYRQLMEQQCGSNTKIDKSAIILTLFLYYTVQKAFSLHETIFTPLSMDQYAWTREQAALWVGIIFLVAGTIAVFTFTITDFLEKRFNERILLLFGFILMFFGFFVYLPWGDRYPRLKTAINKNISLNTTDVGCPAEYPWCKTTPQIHLSQLILGMLFLSVGYPLGLVLTTSIYSKVIGPTKQGLLQSCLAAVGGVARTAGPALVVYMYVLTGPRWTFISVGGLLLLAIISIIIGYKRLIPYHVHVLRKNKDIILMDEPDTLMNTRLKSTSSAETCMDEKQELLAIV